MVRHMLCCCALLLASGRLLPQSEDELAEKSQRGKEAMAAGRFQDAIPIYRELVKALPNNPGLIMNLGLAQRMTGQDRNAIRQFEAALKLDPGLLPARLFLGVSYLRIGQPERAVGPLGTVIEAQPDNAQARQVLADALLSLDRFAEAAAHFRRLSEIESKNPRAWFGLGRSYESLSRRVFAELEKAASESAYWLALVAGARMAQQQYSGAFYFYRQALEKMPNLRGVHAALAGIYRKTGHPDWAAVEDQKERSLGPLNCASSRLECDFSGRRYREVATAAGPQKPPESRYWQSHAYNELALEAFERLMQLPPSADMHEFLAEAHRNQGRHREAAGEWREALNLSPGDPRLQKELAISLHQSRDYQAAQALLQALLKRDPGSVELNYLLGDTLLNLQQGDKAIPLLKKAVSGDPGLLAAQASLARAYLQVGQGEQAIPHLQAALQIDDDGSLHYQLARAYQSAGRQELAKETLQKYQRIQESARAQRQQLEQEVRILPPQ